MSKRNVFIILLLFFVLIITIILFTRKKAQNSSNFSNAPEALELVSSNEVITDLTVNKKDIISSNIEKTLNSAYSDYTSFRGNISDYFSDYAADFELDFGSISNVNSFVNDSLYESIDFFDNNGELIKSKEDLPDITYRNRKAEISEDIFNLKNGSYYIIRYFDSYSIYTPYFIVYFSNNKFSVDDIWVVSKGEAYIDYEVVSEIELEELN